MASYNSPSPRVMHASPLSFCIADIMFEHTGNGKWGNKHKCGEGDGGTIIEGGNTYMEGVGAIRALIRAGGRGLLIGLVPHLRVFAGLLG